MPFLMMECVCPPQTSMIFQGRVVTWAISRAMRCAISPLRNSVRYFIGVLQSDASGARPAPPHLPTLSARRSFHRDSSIAARLAARAKASSSLGQFLVEHAQGAEIGERLLGRLLVDLGDGKAHVDDGVVADLDLGHVVQADVLDHAAEVDPAHADHAVGSDLFDFSGNRQAHSNLLIPLRPDGQM